MKERELKDIELIVRGAFWLIVFVVLFSWLLIIVLDLRVNAESPVEAVKARIIQAEQVEMKATYNVPLDDELQLFIINLCEEHHIDPAVVISIIDAESDFDADAIGDNGASFGLMQIQARWHRERMDKLGVTNLLDPYQNVKVGVDYLAELLDSYDGNVAKALIAYNAGQLGAYKYYFSSGVYSNDYSEEVLAEIEPLTEGMINMPYRSYSNDPIADFDAWDTEQNKRLATLPVCADCDEPIQDEFAYYINGEWICENCIDSYRREVLPE